jgi:hypothetical protein
LEKAIRIRVARRWLLACLRRHTPTADKPSVSLALVATVQGRWVLSPSP